MSLGDPLPLHRYERRLKRSSRDIVYRKSSLMTRPSMITLSGYSWIGRSLTPRHSLSSSLSMTMADLMISNDNIALGSIPEEKFSPRRHKRKIFKKNENREDQINKIYWMEMKRYFEEIDAFVLAVEGPSPVKRKNSKLKNNIDELCDKIKDGFYETKKDYINANDSEINFCESPNSNKNVIISLEGDLHKEAVEKIQAEQDIINLTSYHQLNIDSSNNNNEEGYIINSACEDKLNDKSNTQRIELVKEVDNPEEAISDDLFEVLKYCGQEHVSRLSDLPSIEEILKENISLEKVSKVGEGTFGEAFKCENLVFKIMPLEGKNLVNGFPQRTATETLPEIIVSQLLSNIGGNSKESENWCSLFAVTSDIKVCRGKYPQKLIHEWRLWKESAMSENDDVATFEDNQLFIIFFIEDGGKDLEHFRLENFKEAKSLLFQAAVALAVAEESLNFEHRDLHWGNILLSRNTEKTAAVRLRGKNIKLDTAGVKVTLIDFSQSRLSIKEKNTVIFFDLAQDPELFLGPIDDCQSKIYRKMRDALMNDWSKYCPATNCYWLHYLANIILTLPELRLVHREKKELIAFKNRCLRTKSCNDLLWDIFYKNLWTIK